ncbi:MAG: CDP-diacylglycerol--glycerol-3-phosphate 3-phosphatidyltransferase [Lapillicoccus sp.]
MDTMGGPGADKAPAVRAPSAWNIPNLLTVVRILLVPVFGWLLLVDDGRDTGYRLAAFGVFAVAMFTDSIDGDLARRRNSVTDFGKVSDPIADKALTGMALVGLSIIAVVPWWVTAVILVREVAVTVMRFVVIRHGVMPASRGGKVKTLLQSAALGMLIIPATALPFERAWSWIAYAVLAAALVVTVVTGVDYAIKAQTLRRTSPRAMAKRAARLARRTP